MTAKKHPFAIIPKRSLWYSISGLVVAGAIACIGIFGLNFGIDFTGGTEMEVSFSNGLPEEETVIELFKSTVGTEKGEKIIQMLGKDGYVIRSQSLTEKEVSSFTSAIKKENWGANIDKVKTIGPTVGEVFKKRAFLAIALSLAFIILFVAIAFYRVPEGLSPWKFGLAAIVALAHDVTIIIGLFALLGSILGIEVDSLFITALLTVLGFSVNDTIVIFDRIRENLKGEKTHHRFATLCENALWQSMRRSINTSLSTLLVIGTMLYFFAGGFPALFSFFFALAAGIIVGTYSSLFLAAPLLVSWHKK